MKHLTILLLIALSSLAARATEVISFHHQLLSDPAVRLFWEVDNTSGIIGFEVERSTDNQHFSPISGRILCNGNLDYDYTDHPGQSVNSGGVIRKSGEIDLEQTYYYRLVYLLPNQGRLLADTPAIEVDLQLNTVRTTWGGIKAMFR